MTRIVATLCVRPDIIEESRALVGELVKASWAEDGNLAYNLCAARDDSASLVVPGTWRNDIVIKARNTSAYFITLVPRMVGLCAEPPSVVQYAEA